MIFKEVNVLHIPDIGWTHGSWNGKREQFGLLGRMIGISSRPSSGELQEALKRTASAKVFAESVQGFIEATGMEKSAVANELEHINKKLGTMEPVPFRSKMRGQVDPTSFEGIAILPPGTVSWTQARWDITKLSHEAGANFERVIVLGSNRVCNAAADRRHPYIAKNYAEGEEPTERQLLNRWISEDSESGLNYVMPDIPAGEDDRPLSLEAQLKHLMQHAEYRKLLTERQLFVPANPNALYVPLHVCRVLGRQDIWFAQGGARIQRETPNWWWPQIQDLWTTPSGIIRLWIELQAAGCITS